MRTDIDRTPSRSSSYMSSAVKDECKPLREALNNRNAALQMEAYTRANVKGHRPKEVLPKKFICNTDPFHL